MVDTIKFSEMTPGGDIDNDKKTPGLKDGGNVLFNNPWTFLPSGSTAARPAPAPAMYNRLRFNTDDQIYEYYDSVAMLWTQLAESTSIFGPILTYDTDPTIPDAQNLGLLGDGILKQTVTAGAATLDIALAGTDYWAPGDALTRTQVPTVGDDVTNKTYVDSLIIPSFTTINIQVFLTSGTYTPTTNLKYCQGFVLGAGGAGGGANGAAGELAYGTCGGAGSLSILNASAATIGASQTITVGAGGTGVSNNNGNAGSDSSIGSLCIGKGGAGGNVGVSTATLGNLIGGDGGIAGTGDVVSVGNMGGGVVIVSGSGGQAFSGTPGSTMLGGAVLVSDAPDNTGAGGSGRSSFNGGGAVAGYDGSSGIVWIVEYI